MSKLDVFVFRRALDRLSVVTRCSKTLTMRRFGYKGGQQKRRPERQHPGAIYRIPWIQILSTPVQSTRRCRVTPSVVSCSHELTAEDLNLNSMAFWSYRFDKKVDLVEKGVTDFVLHVRHQLRMVLRDRLGQCLVGLIREQQIDSLRDLGLVCLTGGLVR
jgi:hypothetical protein